MTLRFNSFITVGFTHLYSTKAARQATSTTHTENRDMRRIILVPIGYANSSVAETTGCPMPMAVDDYL